MRVTYTNELAQLSELHEPGSPQWCEQFVASIHQIVQGEFRDRVPARLRSVFSVEDLAQETSIRLVEHVFKESSFRDVSRGLVVVVARRVLIDRVREYLAQKRTPKNGFLNISPTSSACLLNDIAQSGVSTPSQLEMNQEFWVQATSFLDQREWELVDLKYNEDLTDEEIGEIFGKSPQAIRSLLFRVRRKIKDKLSSYPEYESFF